MCDQGLICVFSCGGIGLAASDPRAQNPSQWRGTNLLGKCLMRARDELRKHSAGETKSTASSTVKSDDLEKSFESLHTNGSGAGGDLPPSSVIPSASGSASASVSKASSESVSGSDEKKIAAVDEDAPKASASFGGKGKGKRVGGGRSGGQSKRGRV